MFKNLSNLTLIGILVLLAIGYFTISYLNKSSRSGSFHADIINIDTAKVTALQITGGKDSVYLLKENNDWKLRLASGKIVDAEDQSVRNSLGSLLTIAPSRIATRDQEKWKEYQVDTAGTRVKVFEGDKKTLDLIVGRFGIKQGGGPQGQQFGMQGGQQFYTYVRLAEEPEVYAADNFMGYSVNPSPAGFRNNHLFRLTTDSVTQIAFRYPADSSFTLMKEGSGWSISGQPADSTEAASYLNDIRVVSKSAFADDINSDQLGAPLYQAEISLSGKESVAVSVYPHNQYHFVVHSSRNPDAYFVDEDTSLVNKVFVERSRFIGN